MANTKCRAEREGKTERKTVGVSAHKRSAPKPIRRKCGR